MAGSVSSLCRRYARYLLLGFEYYVLEKPRGLDFTMRDTSLLEQTGGRLHGYSKTNERHVRAILDALDIPPQGAAFLDVGCGKGVVLREAAKYPFDRIGGIDIDSRLIRIAQRNFEILHLSGRIACTACDAQSFPDYGSYDTFFFFNPFDEEPFEAAVDQILRQCREQGRREIRLIYHHPSCQHVLDRKGVFTRTHVLYDSLKGYETYIYQARLTDR